MPSTRIKPKTFFANGLETVRNINCHQPVLGHRAIPPWHVGLIACFILILIAAFGKPASPLANGGPRATTGVNIATPEYSAALAELEIPSATRSEPFGLHSVQVKSGWLLNTWRDVQNDIRVESEILMRCRAQAKDCSPAAKTFLAIVAEGRAYTGRARVGVINRAINLAIRAKRDPANWMGPLATLTKGSGDCKDYAIAKYVALGEAGIAWKDLRIVIVHDLALDEDHAIVATRLGRNWIMLDNRWLALAQDADLRRVVPLFILDRDGLRRFIREKTAIGWYDIRFSAA